jgi:hypothetical protein
LVSSTHSGLYRPVTKLTYRFDSTIPGSRADPASHHSVNFLLHGVNMPLAFYLGLTLFEEMALAPAAPVGMAYSADRIGDQGAGGGTAGRLWELAGWLRHNRAREKKWPWLAVLAAICVYQKESAAWRSMISPGPNRTGPAYACAAIPSAGFAWARTYALHGAGAVRARVHGPRWPLPAFGRPSGGGEGDRK